MIRKYDVSDTNNLIDLLNKNIPDFFAPSEKTDYIDYLTNELEDYYIYEIDNIIVGCGGINYEINNRIARISWDIVHPDYQGKGIEKKLVNYRVNHIKNNSNINTVIVRTSQLAFKFYQKQGFQLKSITENFWAKGFHLYLMFKRNK